MRAVVLLMASLLAGIYVALLRHARRRTVLRPASRDCDITVETPTLIGGEWQSRGPEVDNGSSLTTLSADSNTASLKLSTAVHHVSSEFLSEMARRRRQIHRICSDTGNTTSRDMNVTSKLRDLVFARSLLFDAERRLVYCAVPKVASSSVKMAMAQATGRVDESRPISVHDSSYMARLGLTSLDRRLATGDNNTWHELVETLGRMRKFIVVRHPMQRVVSAYRDKFERDNHWNQYFHNKYGKLIVFKYRQRSATFDGAEHNVSFAEFVRFLTDRRLSDRRRYNAHWAPVSDLCRPCQIDFDYVIKLEQFAAESSQLWKALYGDETPILPATIRRNVRTVRTSRDVTRTYLRQLTRRQTRLLTRLYADDFRLFSYSNNIFKSTTSPDAL